MEETQCSDIWRDRNEDKKIYTYCKQKPKFTGSRLDFFLVDLSISAWVNKVLIKPGYRSDHSAVLLELLPFQINRGKGFWKLNNQILYEAKFVQKIQEVIEQSEQYAKRLNDREKWDSIKLQIIATAQEYSRDRASERKLIFAQLEEMIEKI